MASDPNFLESLPVSPKQREQLRSLGVGSAFELLSTILASKAAFFKFFGRKAALELIPLLEAKLSDSQKAELRLAPPSFSTGAIVDRPAQFQPPEMDVSRREALLQQIERLRGEPDGEKLHEREIERLEREIAALY